MRMQTKKPGKIKSAILNWLGVPGTLTDPEWWAAFGAHSDAGQNVTPDSALKLSAVWACTRLIAETISTLPLSMYERTPGGKRLADHPLQMVIHDMPNPDSTASVFWESMVAAMLLRGNGRAEKLMSGSRVVGLAFLDPGRLVPSLRGDGTREWRYTEKDGKQRVIPKDRIWRVPGFSLDGEDGVSVIRYGANVFGSAQAASSAADGTFDRGLMPTTYFKFPAFLKPEQRSEFRENLTKISGAINAGKPALLEGGMDTGTIGINPVDAQLLESRAFSVEEICFVPGTKVLTMDGFKAIESIRAGESVLTHKGRWRRVRNVMQREYSGPVVTAQAKGLNAVTSTTNHPFYVQELKPNRSHKQEPVGTPKWIDASDMRASVRGADGRRGRGEFHALTIPKIAHDISIVRLDMSEWANNGAPMDDESVWASSNTRATPVNRFVPLDANLGWLCGVYASDGSATDHQVVFYLGAHETETVQKLRQTLKDVFGVDETTTIVGSVSRTVVSNRVLAEFFSDFGSRADLKVLPNFAMSATPEFRSGVVSGLLDGDGCRYKNRHLLRTTSERLAWQLRMLLWTDGVHGALSISAKKTWSIEGRSGAARPIYTVEWRPNMQRRGSMGQTDEIAYFGLNSVAQSEYVGYVYNLEVEEDESYTTEGGCVHNCRWFRVPPFMVGHSEKSTSWGTGIEQQMIGFLTFTLAPWLRRIEQAISKDLLTPSERLRYYPKFSVEGLLRADSAGRAAFYGAMVNNGVLTRDEVRELEDRQAMGGNAGVLTVQSAMTTLDSIGSTTDAEATRAAMRAFLGFDAEPKKD